MQIIIIAISVVFGAICSPAVLAVTAAAMQYATQAVQFINNLV
jgi:hypothetical protein